MILEREFVLIPGHGVIPILGIHIHLEGKMGARRVGLGLQGGRSDDDEDRQEHEEPRYGRSQEGRKEGRKFLLFSFCSVSLFSPLYLLSI